LAFALFLLVTLTFDSAPSAAAPYAAPYPYNMHAVTEPLQLQAEPALAEAADAPIIEIATTSSPKNPDAVYRRTSATAAWLLLSLTFSFLAAFNLALLRHMRKVYASPRRR
jgi:hypothetical protein